MRSWAKEGKVRQRSRLYGDHTRGARVVLRPMFRESGEVFLGYDVVLVGRCRVEAVEDDSDEEVHEDVRDGQGEAVGG